MDAETFVKHLPPVLPIKRFSIGSHQQRPWSLKVAGIYDSKTC